MQVSITIKTIISAVLIFLSISAGLEKTIKSRTSQVTVYKDRAMVTREGRINLPAGGHQIVLKDLPDRTDENSVRVTGTGFGQIRDIEFFHDHFEEIQDEKLKRLTDEKSRLEDSLAVYQNRISQSVAERQLVENIVKKLTAVPEKDAGPAELNPEKWIKIVSYYRTKLRETASEQRVLEKLKIQANDKVEKINREIADLNAKNAKMTNGIKIKVVLKSQGTVGLKVSYIVYGVGWNPVYDIRVLSNKKQLILTYKGKIRQNTAEDWTNVELNLSTASPSVDGTLPELRPWHLSIAQILPLRESKNRLMKMAAPAMVEMDGLAAGAGRQKKPRAAPAMARTRAIVQAQATSVLYAIPGKCTIAGDNKEHTVRITELEFSARLDYSAIPKLSPHVYLKAEVINTSPYSFLPGMSNIFLDNHFVSRAIFDMVAPTQTFKTSLGVDAGITVERKLLRKYRSKEGLRGRKNRMIYEYAIDLESHKNSVVKLTLLDQLPVSNDERIQVVLLKPGNANKSKTISINDTRIIQWDLELKPNGKATVPFEFSVTWPKGERVSGL